MPRECQPSIRPSPQTAKHRCVGSLADGFRPFRAGMRFDAPNPGRCPGRSPCAPLGHKTIHHSAAPKGHIEIAQGKAKRRPGDADARCDEAPRKCQPSIRPSPQRAKHRCVGFLADGFRPFRAGMRFDAPIPGRCPGLSPCAPLGHKTIGSRTTNHRGPNSPEGA